MYNSTFDGLGGLSNSFFVVYVDEKMSFIWEEVNHEMSGNGSKWVQIIRNGSKLTEMGQEWIRNGSRLSEMSQEWIRNGSRLSEMGPSYQKWVKNGSEKGRS